VVHVHRVSVSAAVITFGEKQMLMASARAAVGLGSAHRVCACVECGAFASSALTGGWNVVEGGRGLVVAVCPV
jgi:hypothetical protein